MHEDFVVQDPRSDQRKQSHTLRVPLPNTNSGRQLSPDVSQSQYAYQHESLTTAPHQQPHYYSSWPPREYLTDPPSSQHHNAHMMSTCPSTASDASMYQYMTALSLPTSHPSMAFPEKDDCYAEGDSNHFGLSFERPSTTDSMYLQPYQGHDAQVTLPPLYRYRPNRKPSPSTHTEAYTLHASITGANVSAPDTCPFHLG